MAMGSNQNEANLEKYKSWMEPSWLALLFTILQVYIVGNIPPGVDERLGGHLPFPPNAFQERFNRKYLQLVRKYSDTIMGQFFGHLHSDTFRVIYNEDGKLTIMS